MWLGNNNLVNEASRTPGLQQWRRPGRCCWGPEWRWRPACRETTGCTRSESSSCETQTLIILCMSSFDSPHTDWFPCPPMKLWRHIKPRVLTADLQSDLAQPDRFGWGQDSRSLNSLQLDRLRFHFTASTLPAGAFVLFCVRQMKQLGHYYYNIIQTIPEVCGHTCVAQRHTTPSSNSLRRTCSCFNMAKPPCTKSGL